MKYIFKENEIVGEYPVEYYQICWYDMNDGDCFDESLYSKEIFDPHELLTFVETKENKEDSDRTRVFAKMKNGDIYELKLKKIKHPETLNTFFGE